MLKSSNALSSKSSATGTRNSRGVLAVANAVPVPGQESDDDEHSNYRKKSIKKIGGNLTREDSEIWSQANNRRSSVHRKTTIGGDDDS